VSSAEEAKSGEEEHSQRPAAASDAFYNPAAWSSRWLGESLAPWWCRAKGKSLTTLDHSFLNTVANQASVVLNSALNFNKQRQRRVMKLTARQQRSATC
jgi:hypothetical protein